jgi:cytochrome c5
MLNIAKYQSTIKKISAFVVILFVAVSCSKKVTGNKSVEKPPMEMEPLPPTPEPPAMPEKKIEAATIVNANTVGENPGVAKPLEMAKTPTKEDIAATEAKKKLGILMAAGKEAYSVKCTKCHEAFEPTKFNAAKWEKVIDWMGPRAKLEAHEKEEILAYVKNNAKK